MLGKGSFGVTKLMRSQATGELVAVKFIERGPKVCCIGSSEICPVARHPSPNDVMHMNSLLPDTR